MRIAVLHPGEMGSAVAAALGGDVIWAPDGRSAATAERAANLTPGDPLTADVILSICPPHAAREVAASVAGFTGLYVDANAISPATSRAVRALVPHAEFVDRGIIRPPPRSSSGAPAAARPRPLRARRACASGAIVRSRWRPASRTRSSTPASLP